jgi:hypothetical protein
MCTEESLFSTNLFFFTYDIENIVFSWNAFAIEHRDEWATLFVGIFKFLKYIENAF